MENSCRQRVHRRWEGCGFLPSWSGPSLSARIPAPVYKNAWVPGHIPTKPQNPGWFHRNLRCHRHTRSEFPPAFPGCRCTPGYPPAAQLLPETPFPGHFLPVPAPAGRPLWANSQTVFDRPAAPGQSLPTGEPFPQFLPLGKLFQIGRTAPPPGPAAAPHRCR